jgi:hypothetical protein
MKNLGQQIASLISAAENEVILVAPFIKYQALQRIMAGLVEGVVVHVVTRWRLDEILAGVSDIDIWQIVQNRPNTTLWLHNDLHAKYYRADDGVLIGSANLTGKALGWSKSPNLEILTESSKLTAFEEQLFQGAIQVDESIYSHFKTMVDAFPSKQMLEIFSDEWLDSSEESIPKTVPIEAWVPKLRHPKKLFAAYQGELDDMTSASRQSALDDLAMLDVPKGLSKSEFNAYVGFQLLQMPIVRRVDTFVVNSQRFGAVRDLLKQLPCSEIEGFDANMAWQTLMRWLEYYLESRYELRVPRHSEIFGRKGDSI